MSSIRIGDVEVQDVNQNEQYEVAVDPVVDLSGQQLTASVRDSKMDAILKSIQAKSWQGLSLPDVAQLFEGLQAAEDAALRGEPEESFQALQEAKDAAKTLRLAFSRSRADQIYQNALNNRIGRDMAQADQIAASGGDIEEVKQLLASAEEFVAEYNVNFSQTISFDQKKADRILKSAYIKGIAASYFEADVAGQQGDYSQAESIFQAAQNHIQEALNLYQIQIRFDQSRATAILRNAYSLGIPEQWLRVEKLAKAGQTAHVRLVLQEISQATSKANRNFQLNLSYDYQRADQVMGTALIEGVADNFKLAERLAQGGSIAMVQKWLQRAESYVQEYNQKYASQANNVALNYDQARSDQIMEAAYQGAIRSNFQFALQHARLGNINKTQTYLQKASDLADEYNQNIAPSNQMPTLTFDQVQADLVKDCALKKTACP